MAVWTIGTYIIFIQNLTRRTDDKLNQDNGRDGYGNHLDPVDRRTAR